MRCVSLQSLCVLRSGCGTGGGGVTGLQCQETPPPPARSRGTTAMSVGLHAGHLHGLLPSQVPGEPHGITKFGTLVEGTHFSWQQVMHVSSHSDFKSPLTLLLCLVVWSGPGMFSHNSEFFLLKGQHKLHQLQAPQPWVHHHVEGVSASPVAQGKDSACQCRRHGFNPWIGKIPWRRKW